MFLLPGEFNRDVGIELGQQHHLLHVKPMVSCHFPLQNLPFEKGDKKKGVLRDMPKAT